MAPATSITRDPQPEPRREFVAFCPGTVLTNSEAELDLGAVAGGQVEGGGQREG
jgi:hypothetical protein